MALNAPGLANRFEGRLFSDKGCLYLVLEVDIESGFAQVSCRTDGEQQVIQMPVSEVGLHIRRERPGTHLGRLGHEVTFSPPRR